MLDPVGFELGEEQAVPKPPKPVGPASESCPSVTVITWFLTVETVFHGSSTFSFHCSARSLQRIFFAGLATCFIMSIQAFNGLFAY